MDVRHRRLERRQGSSHALGVRGDAPHDRRRPLRAFAVQPSVRPGAGDGSAAVGVRPPHRQESPPKSLREPGRRVVDGRKEAPPLPGRHRGAAVGDRGRDGEARPRVRRSGRGGPARGDGRRLPRGAVRAHLPGRGVRKRRRGGEPRQRRRAARPERRRARPRRAHGPGPLALPLRAPAGRARTRNLGRRLGEGPRGHQRVVAHERRRDAAARLRPPHVARVRLLGRRPPGREPLRQQSRRARVRDGEAALALPDRPPRRVGLRPPRPSRPRDPEAKRPGRARGGPGDQDGVRLRPRPGDGGAAVPGGGAPGAPEPARGRVPPPHPALPGEAASPWPASP